jgi:hypothetical protein
MEIITTNYAVASDARLMREGIPVKVRPRRLTKRAVYLTTEAVSLAKQNPNVPVRLGGDRLVDKAYEQTLRGQAAALGPNFALRWVWEEDRNNESTPSGKVSYNQMGRVYLTWIDTEGEVEPTDGAGVALVPGSARAESAPQGEKQEEEAAAVEKAAKKARKKARKKAAKREAAAAALSDFQGQFDAAA